MFLLWIMIAFLLLYIVMVVRGPSVWDRFLALSLISTKIVIITVVLASIEETSKETAYILDYTIVSTVLWFMCIIFTAVFLQEDMRNRVYKERRKE